MMPYKLRDLNAYGRQKKVRMPAKQLMQCYPRMLKVLSQELEKPCAKYYLLISV